MRAQFEDETLLGTRIFRTILEHFIDDLWISVPMIEVQRVIGRIQEAFRIFSDFTHLSSSPDAEKFLQH